MQRIYAVAKGAKYDKRYGESLQRCNGAQALHGVSGDLISV
jgi:hypothetical protein